MSAIRALASNLAARSDAALGELLTARPDLALPQVPDFAALAARAASRASVLRALDTLNEPQLRVLEASVLVTDPDSVPASRPDTGAGSSSLHEALRGELGGTDPQQLHGIIAELEALALLFREPALRVPDNSEGAPETGDGGLQPVPAVREAVGPYPAGLGRPFTALANAVPGYARLIPDAAQRVGRLLGDAGLPAAESGCAARYLESVARSPMLWRRLLEAAPLETAGLLARFAASPVGSAPATSAAEGALAWLLDHGILTRLDAVHVELPREAGRAARGHLIIPGLSLHPPEPALPPVRPALRDNAAYSAIAETLRLMSELTAAAGDRPVATLRSGGVGIRELGRVADALQVGPEEAAWLLELAAMAGILVLDVDTSRWIAATESNWGTLPREEQWRALVHAWLRSGRAPSLVGKKTSSGALINTLSAEPTRPDAPAVRQAVLRALTALTAPADDGAPRGADAAAITGWLAWHQPRGRRRLGALVPGILGEAEHLGLAGSGALTRLGGLAATGRYDDAAELLAGELPAPLSHFLLQADLTAVAPGYLEASVTAMLTQLASQEGRGPAAIYRFSPASIRRALDAGHEGTDILDFLSNHASGGIPQPLRYLVEDTASRHGRLRVGAAAGYVRSTDTGALDALLSDPRAKVLGLERIAPTVATSRLEPRALAAALRDIGHETAPESAPTAGASSANASTAGHGPHRRGPAGASRTRPPSSSSSAPAADAEAHRAGAVRLNPWMLAETDMAEQLAVLRSGGASTGPPSAESETMLGLETFRRAIRLRLPVELDVVDAHGNQSRQVLVPLTVTAGRVRAVDPKTQVEQVVSIHRIMDVQILEGAASDG